MFSEKSFSHKSLALKFITTLLSLLVLAGCQSTLLTVHHQTNASFFTKNYKTVNIETMTPSERPAMKHILNAIEAALVEKGYIISTEAELTVLFGIRLQSDQVLQLEQIPYKGNIATKSRLESVYTASMLVNAIDNESKKVVWKAFTTKNLNNTDTSKLDPGRLKKSISEVFESLPETSI